MTIEIRQHPTSGEHWLCIVTTSRGLCYFCTWAGDKPTEKDVLEVWQEDRRVFDPYIS